MTEWFYEVYSNAFLVLLTHSAIDLVVASWIVLVVYTNAIHWIFRYLKKRQLAGHKAFFQQPDIFMSADKSPTIENSPANERRKKLSIFLKELAWSENLPIEFIEVPPGFKQPKIREFAEDQVAPYWHSAHLKWQLKADRFLLAERVSDAVECIRRTDYPEGLAGPEGNTLPIASSILIEPQTGSKGTVPWRVVIETSFGSLLKEKLYPIRNWLGVDVTFHPATVNHLLGKCISGDDGLDGVVAGVVDFHSSGERFGLACQHYLSENCNSLKWPHTLNGQGRGYDEAAPDMALLSEQSPCFDINGRTATHIQAASDSELEIMLSQKSMVEMRPKDRGVFGGIDSTGCVAFVADNISYRGPHILVTPAFTRRWGLVWPLFNRQFSKNTDSGSWITNKDNGLWVGMVVAGKEPPNVGTWAIPAWFIEDVLMQKFKVPFDAKLLD